MNILDGLLGEHAALLTVFEHLEQKSSHMSVDELQEAGALLERLLMAHSVGEDRFLFDAVKANHGMGVEETLIAMRGEHRVMAAEIATLRACDKAAQGRSQLRRLIESTREHFGVEERVLFAVAARELSREKLEELGDGWKRFRMREAVA